jgi:hypothetical protein
MAKYIALISGKKQEVSGLATSGGTGDAGKIVQLDSTGRLDNSLLPVGIGADTGAITASEALSAGDFVNVFNSSGNARVRKADATVVGKEAHGFVLATFAANVVATVYFEGTNTQVTAQVPGTVYLSTTAGAATGIAPTASGQTVQSIGFATGATSINFNSGDTVVLAG